MLTSQLLGAVAFALGVHAQAATPTSESGASPASAAPSSTSSVNIIPISVGAENHKFVPDQVNASVGDIIRFNFYPGGHRVARAEFGFPCIPYEYTGGNKEGFWTGVFTPQVITNPPPHYDVRVNDTNTIFFYCGAPGSCIQYGMVGVINPTAEKNLTYQKALALNSTLQLVPGDPFPSETLSLAPTPSATSAPKSGDPTPQTGNGTAPVTSSDGPGGLGAGAIAGIAIGAAAVLILGGALIYMCGRRGGFETAYRKSIHHGGVPPPGMVEHKFLDPKSPGQATLSTFPNVERDPYRVSAQSGHGAFSGTPPPHPSPGMPGYGNYASPMSAGTYPVSVQTHQPLAFHAGQTSPQPTHSSQFQSPIELPTADHPAGSHSPPPQYKVDRRDSQTTGGDGGYYQPPKP
ncbi:hypothetical protein QBC47DRAFT_214851 [Echria macrotheca]|uniref:Extracellular serine-rich protein n=1 Tax=Echria macrotheca TaxID=438768 RepID=A0AAJ0F679_9PEZI|nr:hypothetical protein QBC47DRAFT_214851 [Echria macrotheca]